MKLKHVAVCSVLLSFIVTWAGQPSKEIVPCPESAPYVNKETRDELVAACIVTRQKVEEKSFPTEKEANSFLLAIRELVDKNATIKKSKEKSK